MKITFNEKWLRFEATVPPNKKTYAKNRGLSFDRKARRWYAPTPAVALTLAEFADPATVAIMHERAAASAAAASSSTAGRKAKEDALVASSHATSSDVHVPAPVGLAYTPFQRAAVAYAKGREAVLLADEDSDDRLAAALGCVNLAQASSDVTLSVLMVTSKTDLPHWKAEAERWLVRPPTVATWTAESQEPADLVLVGQDALLKGDVLTRVRGREWDFLVCDQAQFLVPDCPLTQAVLGSRRRGSEQPGISSARRLFLTDGSTLNGPGVLFPLLEAAGLAKDEMTFKTKHCAGWSSEASRPCIDPLACSDPDGFERFLRMKLMVRRTRQEAPEAAPEAAPEQFPAPVVASVPAVAQVPAPGPAVAAAPVIASAPAAPKRGRGRPRLNSDATLSKAERNARWREAKDIVAVEVPRDVAELLSELKAARGGSYANLLRGLLAGALVAQAEGR